MTNQCAIKTPALAVIPLGKVGEMATRIVAANLQAVLSIPVDILDVRPLPEDALDPNRHQYDATRILKILSQYRHKKYAKMLAIVAVDLCIPILTHVFGEAQLGGELAIISGYRLRNRIDGVAVPLEQYYARLAKVALHEMAHTFSLYHCDEPQCLMRFSIQVEDLDELPLLFCERCEFLLRKEIMRLLNEGGTIVDPKNETIC